MKPSQSITRQKEPPRGSDRRDVSGFMVRHWKRTLVSEDAHCLLETDRFVGHITAGGGMCCVDVSGGFCSPVEGGGLLGGVGVVDGGFAAGTEGGCYCEGCEG